MPRRRITRLTNRALKSGDLTDAFRHTGFAEAVQRGLASPRSLVRAAARLALAVDAVVLPFVRHLREQAGRLPFFTDAASYSPHRILRRGLLTYSAALMAIGAGVAVGLVPVRSDLDLAAGRS